MSDKRDGMTMSGYCMWPAVDNDSHLYCRLETCTCECHEGRNDTNAV